ncbi:SH3 domain-containing protein [Clostridium paraputrificum]|uniref:C40 family peptidase n=1 Tax=Clostridium paraputrificum TaxID=29363 RepID=UPI003D34054E
MNRKKILQIIIAASTFAGGITLSQTAAQAVPVTDEGYNQEEAINNARNVQRGQVVNITSNLRVRSEATTSSSVIGYLNNGESIEIKGETGSWYRINFNGKEGYVSKEYIKVTSSNAPSSGEKGQVINITSSLRIRQTASTSSAVIGSLQNGDTFDIIAKSGQWYNIKSGSTVGFIHGDYVKVIGNSTTPPSTPSENPSSEKGKVVNITSNLRVRTSPSTSASTLGYLLNGEEVEITGESGDWYKINFKGTTGYAHKDYIEKTGSSNSGSNNNNNNNNNNNSNNGSATGEKGQVINITTSLTVRSGASTSSAAIGYLKNGAEVEITGESGSWYKINYNGTTGYVHKDYVKKAGSSDSGSSNNGGSTNVETIKGHVVNAPSGLRIRSGASTTSTVLGTLQNGQNVDIKGESGEWYKIDFNGTIGYAHKDYIQKGESNNSGSSNNGGSTNVETIKGHVVNAPSGLRIRSAASTTSAVLGTLQNGQNVDIKGESGEWYKIDFNGTIGYAHKDYIQKGESNNSGSSNNGGSTNVENKKGQVYNVTSNLRVRSEANANSSVLGYLLSGEIVDIIETTGDWYKILFNSKPGYVSKDYIKIVDGSTSTNPSSTFENVFNAMKAHLGSPYVWGGSGEYLTTSLLNMLKATYPSQTANGAYIRAERYADKGYRAFDCSGLMQWGFRQAGINIGRSTWDQIGNGREVSLNSLKPGDLLFYSNLEHVGMYIGNGQWIEAPNKNADVRIANIPWSKIGRARRVLN